MSQLFLLTSQWFCNLCCSVSHLNIPISLCVAAQGEGIVHNHNLHEIVWSSVIMVLLMHHRHYIMCAPSCVSMTVHWDAATQSKSVKEWHIPPQKVISSFLDPNHKSHQSTCLSLLSGCISLTQHSIGEVLNLEDWTTGTQSQLNVRDKKSSSQFAFKVWYKLLSPISRITCLLLSSARKHTVDHAYPDCQEALSVDPSMGHW